jgi:Protein of unknown function (DUF3105)
VRRVLPVIAGVVILLAGLFGLISLFSGRDSGGVGDSKTAAGPGTLEAVDGGGTPPASGPHEKRNVTSEKRIGEDALLTALELGDVVIVHPPGRSPAALKRLQDDVSGPFDPELAAAGQMVIVTPWPGVTGVEALAYRRRLQASGPDDPQLRTFAEAWLGVGRGESP